MSKQGHFPLTQVIRPRVKIFSLWANQIPSCKNLQSDFGVWVYEQSALDLQWDINSEAKDTTE